MNYKLIKLATLTLMSGLLVLPNTQALAYNNQLSDAKTAIENISKVDPHKEIIEMENKNSGDIELKQSSFNKLTLEQDNLKIEIDKKKGIVDLNTEGKETPKIKIPNNQTPIITDNKLIYTNPLADKIVEPISGGVRQIIHIKNSSAPKFYDFPIELEENQEIILNEAGGGKVIDNTTNKTVLTIIAPWAKDAEGNDLETYYEIVDKNVLRQHIDFNEGTAFPVSADPTWCGSQIHSSEWNFLEDVYTDASGKSHNDWSMTVKLNWCGKYSVFQTPCIVYTFGICSSLVGYNTWDAWTEAYEKAGWHHSFNNRYYGSDDYWKMHDQFVCHYVNPATWVKDAYNLEPWRPHVGMAATYANFCNPKP